MNTSRTSPAGILDAIDAAVSTDAPVRCACGCQALLSPTGPSEWFATDACQRAWQAREVTDEDVRDVYQRPEAATALHDEISRGQPIPAQPIPERAGILMPSCPDLFGAGYRRLCSDCRAHRIPAVFQHAGSNGTVLRLYCPSCQTELAGLAVLADITDVDTGPHGETRFTLRMTDGVSSVRRYVLRQPGPLPARNPDSEGTYAATWREMERELKRFRRSYHGIHHAGGGE